MLWDVRDLEEYSIEELFEEIHEIDILDYKDLDLELHKLKCKELIRNKKIENILEN